MQRVPSAGLAVHLPSNLKPGFLAFCHFLCCLLSTILRLSPLPLEMGVMVVISQKGRLSDTRGLFGVGLEERMEIKIYGLV